MNAGQFNKRIQFLSQSTISDSYGELINDWREVATTWAHIQPLQARELFHAKQIHAEVTTKIIVRYRPNITLNMRIQYGERTLEIVSATNVEEKGQFLEVLCKEVL